MALLPEDLKFLREALRSFIESAIQRVAHSGGMEYRFRLPADDIKRETHRQRIYGGVVADYEEYFHHHNVAASFNEKFAAFEVDVDLARCVLDQNQSEQLSAAMSLFRSEHG